jgi:hypothetical protein
MVRTVLLSLLITLVSAQRAAAQPTVTVTPQQPLIERTKAGQSVSFDFIIENKGTARLELSQVRLSVFDARGNLVLRKQAWSGIDAVFPTSPTIDHSAKLLVLNPFHSFDGTVELAKLEYELVFEPDGTDPMPQTVVVAVAPQRFQPKTKLGLPVRGRVLVYEGHDFYAHHRRVDLTNPVVAKLGVTTNPTRYSYDFCLVDARGALFENKGEHDEDWLGFGTPILAPGAGVVKEVRNDVDDNVLGVKMFDFQLALKDIKAFYGNYVFIDHQNGEFSVLAHLKKGSVTVKPGDKVKLGQTLAQMGISGDSEFVHVHYQLQNGLELNNEALPSYFDKIRLRRGAKTTAAGEVALDSGDIVDSSN